MAETMTAAYAGEHVASGALPSGALVAVQAVILGFPAVVVDHGIRDAALCVAVHVGLVVVASPLDLVHQLRGVARVL